MYKTYVSIVPESYSLWRHRIHNVMWLHTNGLSNAELICEYANEKV